MSSDACLITFKVSDGGTLSIDGADNVLTRGDCRVLYLGNNPDAGEVMSMARENWDAKQVVGEAYLEQRVGIKGNDPDVDPDELLGWLNEDPDNVATAAARLKQWLEDTALSEEDYDAADLNGVTAQGAALRFWRDGDLHPKDFGIVIVEGEFPGSSYFAAELRESIEYANQMAITLDAPVRFI